MEHLTLKAVATVTDEGTFTAVISTATIDREKDIVEPKAMVDALQKWAGVGKRIPLLWHHSTAAEDNIGHIEPASAKAVGNEVVVEGWIDQNTTRGTQAWRLVKSGTLGFSFGYLVPEGGSTRRKGGGNHITELDVYEMTATSTPMNGDTRVIGWKADVPSEQLLNAMLGMAMKFIDQEDDDDDIAAMRDVADRLKALGAAEASEPGDSSEDGKALRRRADAVALEAASDGESGKKTPPESEPDLEQEVQNLKSQLVDVCEQLEDLKKKATVDVADKEPKARSVDPLRQLADTVALEYASDGESRRKPPREKAAPEPEPEFDLDELRRRTRDETLIALSGVEEL